MTMGCDEEGNIMGVKANCVFRYGGFASLGGRYWNVPVRMRQDHIIMKILISKGTAYYTNNPPAGAFRDLALHRPVLQTETLLNMMADKVGITPWELP